MLSLIVSYSDDDDDDENHDDADTVDDDVNDESDDYVDGVDDDDDTDDDGVDDDDENGDDDYDDRLYVYDLSYQAHYKHSSRKLQAFFVRRLVKIFNVKGINQFCMMLFIIYRSSDCNNIIL